MTGALNFGMADLYPTMGVYTTRGTSVPDPVDQQSFVDDDADVNNVVVDGKKSRSIWASMLIVICIIFLLSRF